MEGGGDEVDGARADGEVAAMGGREGGGVRRPEHGADQSGREGETDSGVRGGVGAAGGVGGGVDAVVGKRATAAER